MSKTAEPSDDFMELLTDALRAGPGSPEWHQAVGELRKQGGDTAADDYHLLWTARERLASGKQYRSVKAGPGFTRKLMDGIERLPTAGRKTRSAPVATLIALASVLVLVGVIAVVAWWTYNTAPDHANQREDLTSLVFTQTVLDADFATAIPDGWRAIGSLPLTARQGLRPAPSTSPDYTGGGIVSAVPLSTGAQPLSVDLTLTGHLSDSTIPQLFITDRPDFTPDRATSPHELVWTLQDRQPQLVTPDGHITPAGPPLDPSAATTTVHLTVGRDTAAAQANAGPRATTAHQLPADHPRYVGVRFLSKSATPPSDLAVTSFRIQKTADGK